MIWKGYTGLYILGTDGDKFSADALNDVCKKVVSPSDLFLQIEPITSPFSTSQKAPFRRFLEPLTAVLPLKEMREETLINRFEEKGRYNIRVAQRRGLTAHWVQGDTVSPYTLP
jgi:hypothetical protein